MRGLERRNLIQPNEVGKELFCSLMEAEEASSFVCILYALRLLRSSRTKGTTGMKRQQFSSAALSHLPALVVLVLGLSAAKTGFVAGARAAVPPAITCPGSLDLESREGSIATIRVNVRDDDGNPLVVVWTVDGISYQVNNAPGGVSSVITSEGFPTNSVPATGAGSEA